MKNKNEFRKLENALTRLGQNIPCPMTPPFAANVHDWVSVKPTAARTWRASANVRLTAALIFAIACVFFILPEPRDAFAQWIGLSSARLHSTLTPTLVVISTPSPLVSTVAPTFQTTLSPTHLGTPSTQNHNPGTIQRLYPPRSVPQPTHP